MMVFRPARRMGFRESRVANASLISLLAMFALGCGPTQPGADASVDVATGSDAGDALDASDTQSGDGGTDAPIDVRLATDPVPCPGGDGGTCLPFRFITWNVGNANSAEPNYPLRLSYQAYEDFVASQLQRYEADVIFFQEIMSPSHCAQHVPAEADPSRTCFNYANRPPAVQRLTGPGYTAVCDTRNHVECIAVKDSRVRMFRTATTDPYPAGHYDETGALTPDLPMPRCTYSDGNCDDATCDWESTVSAMTLELAGVRFRGVHVHPNASGENTAGFYTGAPCRIAQLEQAVGTLVDPALPNLFAGDFNVTQPATLTTSEQSWWDRNVAPAGPFTHINQRNAAGQLYNTRVPVAIDHVWVDGIYGTCEVRGRGLVRNPPTAPALDEGFDFAQLPGGATSPSRIDHFATICTLYLPM